MKTYKICCYGSLKSGFYNNYLLNTAKYLGSVLTEPIFTMVSYGSFPAIILNGKTAITIEVYEVDENTLQDLYRLEGYTGKRNHPNNWYDTMDLDTEYGTAEIFYSKEDLSGMELVESGNWEKQ